MHKEPLSVNIEARRNGKLKVKEMLYFMFKYVSVERKKWALSYLKRKTNEAVQGPGQIHNFLFYFF